MRLRAIVSVLALLPVVFIACSSSGTRTDGGTGSTPNLCPTDFQAVCTPAPGSYCVGDNPLLGCGLAALPSGLPCSGSAQCSLAIYPCANEMGAERTDGYICTCLDSHWSCEDCVQGAGLCAEAGAPLDAAVSGEDGQADSGTQVSGQMCIPSNLYAAAEPCPPTDAEMPYTTFNCDYVCFGAARIVGGPSCTVGGLGDAASPGMFVPLTDAGTIVLCCPGEWDAAVQCEWFPKQ